MHQPQLHQGWVTSTGVEPVVRIAGATVIARVSGRDTGGAWSLIETTLYRYYTRTPAHWHAHTTEMLYILEGTLVVTLGPQTVTATPGSVVFVPPGVVHTCFNPTAASARLLLFRSPSSGTQDRQVLSELAGWAWQRLLPGDPARERLERDYDQQTVDQAAYGASRRPDRPTCSSTG